MCGINAIIKRENQQAFPEEVLRGMNASIIRRGPDAEGVWTNEVAGLGMRRLSIVGLSNGQQPFYTKNTVSVCNGEIYNYESLRQELVDLGCQFSTNSDCEVVSHLYEVWGEKGFEKLRGMFAFLIYDLRTKNLIAARDRMGEKPLYYFRHGDAIFVSSEVKALTENIDYPFQPNAPVIQSTLQYNWPVQITETFLQDVHRVEAGHYLVFNSELEIIGNKMYWSRSKVRSSSDSYESAKKETLNLLTESILQCHQGEVPLAVLLSGGVDSSAVAAISRMHKNVVHAITIGYEGSPDCDERVAARKLAADLDLKLHEIQVSAQEMSEYFHSVTSATDEPIPDLASIPQYALYKVSRELGFKILLSGNGSDELFFGYGSLNRSAFNLDIFHKHFSDRSPYKVLKSLIALAVSHPKALIDFVRQYDSASPLSGNPNLSKLKNFKEVFQPPQLTELMDSVLEANSGIDGLYRFLNRSWLTNNCLQIADKLGMSNSLEVRSPFVDHKLVDYVNSLPLDYVFDLKKPKVLLKDILRGIVPNYVLDAPKRGFTPPFSDLANIKLSPHYLKQANDNFNTKILESVLQEHLMSKGR